MKKTIYLILEALIFLACLHFVLDVVSYGFANPKIIKIDNNIIELPKNMSLKEIFFTDLENDKKNAVDLILAEEPYPIVYPEKDMLQLSFSGKAHRGLIMLMPYLNQKNFESFAKTKATLNNNCMRGRYGWELYLFNFVKNKGYLISSQSDSVRDDLEKKLCK